MAQFLLTR